MKFVHFIPALSGLILFETPLSLPLKHDHFTENKCNTQHYMWLSAYEERLMRCREYAGTTVYSHPRHNSWYKAEPHFIRCYFVLPCPSCFRWIYTLRLISTLTTISSLVRTDLDDIPLLYSFLSNRRSSHVPNSSLPPCTPSLSLSLGWVTRWDGRNETGPCREGDGGSAMKECSRKQGEK